MEAACGNVLKSWRGCGSIAAVADGKASRFAGTRRDWRGCSQGAYGLVCKVTSLANWLFPEGSTEITRDS